jgi:predicted pyridoxine 5'-phosphate oxidase superfamily flavin-nucleotide-binding protein
LDNADDIAVGDGAACLFFAPGVTETFRVNGRIAESSPTHIKLDVQECYVHCGKALIRSAFWHPAAAQPVAALPAAARFCMFASADAEGNADASPKGDPEGFLHRIDERTIALPDRTGNRRADGHRNVLAHARVALVAFAPGSTAAFELSGRARLTRDPALLAMTAVEGKTPLLATEIRADEVRAYDSQALCRARIWDADRQGAPGRPNPAATLTAHIKLSQQRSTGPARFAITAEGTEKALSEDYKKNLY